MAVSFERLQELFTRFPGIGARQARRFVYFLLGQDERFLTIFLKEIETLRERRAQCLSCMRFFAHEKKDALCEICADPARDKNTIMVLEKDIDLENVERTDTYRGRYFVLGGTVPILEKNPAGKIRLDALLRLAESEKPKEIILALPTTPEGDNTQETIKKDLEAVGKRAGFSISMLGRGLATGTELEYSDAETIKNALANRR